MSEPTEGGLAVLVVDDNHDAADTCAIFLRSLGHNVHVAYDGFSALDLVKSTLPEVIILDIGMPVMTGYTVAERIRENRALSPPLIVAVTAHGEPEARVRSAKSGIDLHLLKPADMAELAILLQRYEDTRAY